jgi:CheY-like chemotaxis protein
LLKEQIALETRFPKTGTFVRGNANHLQRMLKNLIVNAAEAMGEGQGTIGLSLTTVPVAEIAMQHRFPIDWEPEAASYVCLQIQDSGEGINAADIEQLFDPFFSSKFTGRGLGLPVVMGIVRSHAGGITVESTPRLGSVFRVYLPLVQQDLPPEQTRAEGDGAAAIERTILLVEDEEQVRVMTESMLSRLGFAYLSAENGAEALTLFKRHADSIALVVCDLIMPSMGGWETMDALKEIAPTLPWVMTSGYDETQVMHEGRKQYPQVFLQKPYKKDELGAAIDAAFKQAAHGSPAADVCSPGSNKAVTKA